MKQFLFPEAVIMQLKRQMASTVLLQSEINDQAESNVSIGVSGERRNSSDESKSRRN